MSSVTPTDSTIAIARHAPARRRRTKIVATLGPATDNEDTLVSLFDTGVDVVRVNFSHGSAEQQAERIERVRRTASKVGRYVGIIGDLQGPKIRIESFAAGQTILKKEASFTLDTAMDASAGTDSAVGVAYRDLVNDVATGDTLLLNDGQIVLSVLEIVGTEVRCKVVRGGVLSNRKGLNKQGGGLTAGALTAKDRKDIATAAKLEIDFVAVSFVRNASDVDEARRLLIEAGGKGHIIAKIERAEAVENIDAIIDASNAIMVARGDLAHPYGAHSQQDFDNRNANARIDDFESGPDAGRGVRRRQCGHGRNRRGDAVGRNRGRAIPRGRSKDDGGGLCRR